MTSNKIIAGAVFVLSIVLSVGFFVFNDFFAGSRSLGLIGIFIINFVSHASFFVSGPAFLTVVAGGNLYPPILVALVSSFGATLGETISFAFGASGRYLANHKLKNKKWFYILSIYFKKYGDIILFVFALVPNPLFDAVGLVAGIFGYNFFKYFLLVLAGRFIRYFFFASFCAKLLKFIY